MRSNKNLISTILLCGGLLIAIFSIFCFFGSAIKLSTESQTFICSSVFIIMFGGNVTVSYNGQVYPDLWQVKATPILIVVFVIEIIVILLILIIVISHFTKKIDKKKIEIFTYVITGLILVGAILALTSKNSMTKSFEEGFDDDDAIITLGGGLITYIVLNFIGIATNIASVIIQKKTV